MTEYEVTLVKPDGSREVEPFTVENVALGVAERWEARGEGYRAEVRPVARDAAPPRQPVAA